MSGLPPAVCPPGNSLVVTPHPLTLHDQRIYHGEAAVLLPGERLSSFLARHDVLPGQQWVVTLGGFEVPENLWHLTTPKHGHLIEARRVPEKDVVKLVAIVAIAYFTMGAGGLGAGGLFASGGAIGGGWLAAGAAYMAGSMVINKLLGPKGPSQRQAAVSNESRSPTYSLQGGRNRPRQFETMGLVLGEPYCVPDLAGQPYTFFGNGQQYLWQIFHFGLNCADVNTLRIGQTPIGNFVGVEIMKDGFATGSTGLPVLTTNVDSVTGAVMEAPGGPGPYVQRTSSSDAIVLSLDFEASLFTINLETGAYGYNECILSVEYRLVGTGPWLPFSQDNNLYVALMNSTSKPCRATFYRAVSPGQYEVRVQKITQDYNTNEAVNSVQWQSLKTFQLDTGNYRGQSRMAVQIQATGQLNGTLDELNARCTAKPMPYWNGSTWVTATNRDNGLSNPGALMLLLYRGIFDEDGRLIAGIGASDDEIDLEGLKGFMVFCAAKGFTFDLFLQENISIGELIEQIAAAGMGSRSEHTGKLGVIWFSDDQPQEGALNMATMKPKAFGVDYNTMETADEIEFQYFDRERNFTWKSVRVTAPGVVVPQRTARQTLQGVTNEAQAAVLARFSMGQNLFHRKTVTCEVDLEHVAFRRGTVMALTHDLTQWGYGGRLKAAVNNAGMLTLTLDDVVPAASPAGVITKYIGLRLAGEAQYRIFPVAPFVGTTKTVTLTTAWPGGVPVPGDAPNNPAHDTIWIYDFKPSPGQKLRVSDVSPMGNLDGAKVQFVPESAEFWDYVWNGDYTPPPNGSLLSQGPPVVTRAIVTEELARQGNTFYTELTLTFDLTGSFERAELWGAVDGGQLARIATARSQSLSWRGGLLEVWTLELRTYSGARVGAPYGLTYSVVGLSEKPADVSSFTIDQDGKARWTHFKAPDHLGYGMRWQPGDNRSWGDAEELFTGTTNTMPFDIPIRPTGVCTIMIKAYDTSLNESVKAAAVVINLGDPRIANVVEEVDYQALGYPGEVTNATVDSGNLVADEDASALLWSDNELAALWTSDVDPLWTATTYKNLVYVTAPFVVSDADAGAQLTLLADIIGSSFRIEYVQDGPGPLWTNDALPLWTDDAAPLWEAADFRPWPGSVPANPGVYMWRITITSRVTRGEVHALVARLDVEDDGEVLGLVSITAGGTRLPITKEYRSIKSIPMNLQFDGGTAERILIIDRDPVNGPLIKLMDSAGVSVAGTILAEVKGVKK